MGELNKKFANIIGKMDEKVLKAKLNSAIDMLKKGNTEELAKKISKLDKDEMLEKLSEIDNSTLKELNIDSQEVKNINNSDFEKLSSLLGDQGNEIVEKIKNLLNNK